MATYNPTQRAEFDKLRDLIKGVRVAMLTTLDADGSLRSRPMATQEFREGAAFEGELWFFTERGSAKTREVAAHRQVNVAYSDPDEHTYVSVSGEAEIVDDRAQRHALWSLAAKAWFPAGPDDPRLTLLRVRVQHAEYWDAPSSTMVQLLGFLKAAITGERPSMGDHGRISTH